MDSLSHELQLQQENAVRAWTSFVQRTDNHRRLVRPEILTSWTRSRSTVDINRVEAAPLDDEDATRSFFLESPLHLGVKRLEEELRRTAQDGGLVIGVTDARTRLLWTCGAGTLRRKAENVNFVPGGRWDDNSVGTNALDLANRSAEPAMVFAAEHYVPFAQDWVCWAAPLRDPVSGARLGVIDLSTTWDRSHPIGLATARGLAALIEQAMPRSRAYPRANEAPSEPRLVLRLLGNAEVRLNGQLLQLPRRQTEILALLALHPEGLTLQQLHALLYGDRVVTFSTLKSEVSHLRYALGGQLASRPYKLSIPVSTDVDHVLSLLRRGLVPAAIDAYGGDLLPGTDSPALAEMGEYLAVAVREALLANPEPNTVVRYSELAPYDTAVLEACLAKLAAKGAAPHAAVPLLKARLALARTPGRDPRSVDRGIGSAQSSVDI
jgi:hypothetical protein